MAPAIDRVDHIHVYVTDREASERWYSKTLGLSRVPGTTRNIDSPGAP